MSVRPENRTKLTRAGYSRQSQCADKKTSTGPSRSGGRGVQRETATCGSLRLPGALLGRFRFLVLRTRAGEDAVHPVIVFVARVLVEVLALALEILHRNHRRPRAAPRIRILDGELVIDRVLVRAPEALRELHVLGGSLEGHALEIGEVRRLDHERVAFPMAA